MEPTVVPGYPDHISSKRSVLYPFSGVTMSPGREFEGVLQGEDLKGENDLHYGTNTGRPWVDHDHLARL